MSSVTIYLAPTALTATLITSPDKAERLMRRLFSRGMYRACNSFTTLQSGLEAAEEAFDLTNNPDRAHDRVKLTNCVRSVTLGDVVEVDGVKYVKIEAVWKVLDY